MGGLVLVHHTYDGRKETGAADQAAGWSVVECPDAPPLSEVMVAALRREVLPHTADAHTFPTVWHHCDNNAWGAVQGLLRSGERENGIRLADLLAWCDSRFTGRVEGLWEIREVVS